MAELPVAVDALRSGREASLGRVDPVRGREERLRAGGDPGPAISGDHGGDGTAPAPSETVPGDAGQFSQLPEGQPQHLGGVEDGTLAGWQTVLVASMMAAAKSSSPPSPMDPGRVSRESELSRRRER